MMRHHQGLLSLVLMPVFSGNDSNNPGYYSGDGEAGFRFYRQPPANDNEPTMQMINIDSENCFIKIALVSILESIPCTEKNDFSHLKMAAVVDATPFLELQRFQKISIEDYDLIFCSAYFYHIVSEFSPALLPKFMCVDSQPEKLRQHLIDHFYQAREKFINNVCELSWPETRPLFTPCEQAFINDYFSCMRAKHIARVTGNNVKSVSNKKRTIMHKLHCKTNSDFYITLYFLTLLNKVTLTLHAQWVKPLASRPWMPVATPVYHAVR